MHCRLREVASIYICTLLAFVCMYWHLFNSIDIYLISKPDACIDSTLNILVHTLLNELGLQTS